MIGYDDEDDGEENWDETADEYDPETYTVRCRNCGADVHEDAPACPACGEYDFRSGSRSALQERPGWYVILAVLGIVAVIFALLLH